MKNWKTRLGLVLAMLAMVLAVSVPAVADIDDEEEFVEEYAEVVEDELDAQGLDYFDDITCAIDDENDDDDWLNDIEDLDDDNDSIEDVDDLRNDLTCIAEIDDAEDFAFSDALLAEEFDINDDDDDDDDDEDDDDDDD
jgi:hypothetical protein